jgi:outer membrane receptor protein involved in Fe transport
MIILSSTFVFPQTSGKISGKITDKETGKVIPFANIFVNGTTKGAAADDEGHYTILDVAPGTYSVTASVVGYQKVTVENVTVNVDFTTRLNFKLSPGAINLSAVVITGERNPLVRQDLTNPTVAITQKTIQELPVDEISQVIALQAGVVKGNDGKLHVRGGYGNEIAYTLNGVSVNDPFGNQSAIGMATNAVQEVSVSTGTFSAEYGGALSGVVNYITREGGSNYSFSLRGYTGDNVTNRTGLYTSEISKIDPLNDSRLEGTLGGPMPFDNDIRFFVSGVYVNSKGDLYGQRLYNPTDSYLTPDNFNSTDSLRTSGGKYTKSTDPYFFNPYSSNTNGKPTGDGKYISMNPSNSYNLEGNISYRISPQFKLKYEAVYSKGQDKPTSLYEGIGAATATNFALDYRYNPDGVGTEYNNGLVQTLGLTHTVSSKLFYTLKFSYAKNQYQYYLYKNATDPRYLPDLYQLPISNTIFVAGGTDNYREDRTTTTLGIKGDIDAQLFPSHEFKAGFEYRMYHLSYEDYFVQIGVPQAGGSLGAITNQTLLYDSLNLVRQVPYGNPALYSYFNQKPSQFAAYLQDKIELASTLILNLGLRYELFNPDDSYNPNISKNLTDSLAGYITAYNIPATIKQTLAPRISVSYPITDKGIIRFSYGHFYQNGSLSSLYKNNQYYVLNFGSTPTFGNPNVLPQKSVQYEIGLQQALTDNFKFDLTGFYKDVTNYIYTETIYTDLGREYKVLTNLAYSNVRGITLSFLKRPSPGDIFSASLDYTFSIAEGNRTYPSSEIFFSEQSGQRSEMYLVPLSFDRSHVINGTIALNQPDDWSLGLLFNFQTGTPYTPVLPSGFSNVTFTQNSANQLTQWNVDLKFEKYFKIGKFNYSLFLQVMNLFDTQNELSVYQSSGRALSAVEQTQNAAQFSDIVRRINRGDPGLFGINQINNYYSQRPENVSTPREVRLGFSVLFN